MYCYSGDKERLTSKEGEKIKSKSVIKDDYDSSDDDANLSLDLSSNQELMRTESGDILKNIKKKIDEQLGNYNFPEKEAKERKRSKSALSGVKDMAKLKHKTSLQKHDRHKEKHKDKFRDKEKEKREKVKEMMRKDYCSNFSEGSGEQQQKVKKPVIVRRFQQQPPPMNFNDLLKIAEQKCHEKAPEPVIKIPKKVEERPLTQEEIDRRKRAEDVKRRRKEEEMMYKNKQSNEQPAQTSSYTNDAIKSKSDSNLLKNALTAKSGRNSPSLKANQSASGSKQIKPKEKKAGKYDVENDNVIVCRPSASGSAKAKQPETVAMNPWDRIYGQIKKNNPKPGIYNRLPQITI